MFAALALSVVMSVSPPPPATAADYQLGGAYPPRAGVGIVARDWRAQPAAGVYNICYINAFQTQPEQRRWWLRNHGQLVLRNAGKPVVDSQWGEMLLDTSTGAKRRQLTRIADRWLRTCADKGFDAVEPDNLDSWQRSDRLLRREHNLALARMLIERAHARGLAIAQKNAAGFPPLFDFAVAEECQRYAECDWYRHAYAGRVIEIEYRRSDFRAACARDDTVSIVLRDRLLRTPGQPGYRYATC